jgi:hypothetical protein
MQMSEAAKLQEAWGDKPCNHPSSEREYYLGSHTGDDVCTQCGRSLDPKTGEPRVPNRPTGSN